MLRALKIACRDVMNKDDDLSHEEKELFRRSMKNVRRLKSSGKTNHASQKQSLVKKKSTTLHTVITPHITSTKSFLAANETLFFTRSGIQKKLLTKLRQGQIPFNRKLDLHGLNLEGANIELHQFITHCYHSNIKCVLIVHGKGGQQPILKSWINQRLKDYPEVLAFSSAIRKHGGTGAVYVLIKRRHIEIN